MLTTTLALAALPGILDAAAQDSSDSRAPATIEMADRLARLADEYESRVLGNQPFFNANTPWRIPELRRRVESAADLGARMNARFKLAQQLLWDGQTRAALAETDEIEADGSALTAAQERRSRRLLRPWLAAAHLRLGVETNCLAPRNPAACFFPVKPGGVHSDPSGARAAMTLLNETLAEKPKDVAARWLLILASMSVGDYPEAVPERLQLPEARASGRELAPLPNIAAAAGVDVLDLAGGSVLEDLDGDGDLDLMVSSWGLRDPIRLFRNDGRGRFDDVTKAAGLEGIVGGLNLSHADFDNDGWSDVLVLRSGRLGTNAIFPNSLLRNRGDGTFEDVTVAAGLDEAQPGQTAAWADYDADGDLDVFLGHEWPSSKDPNPSMLMRNEGDGTFVDVALDVGLAQLGWVIGATWGDYDNDDRPDLYVSRLRQPNQLLYNAGPDEAGGWGFFDVADVTTVEAPRSGSSTCFFDYDNDGWLDLFAGAWDGATLGQVAAAELGLPGEAEHARLYHNERTGIFRDVSDTAGIGKVLLAVGANFGDIEGDGWLDLYIGTGGPDLWTLLPNRMLGNENGRRFSDVTEARGVGHLQKGHGISFGDVDGDGDEDVLAVMGGWYSGDEARNVLFENPGSGAGWVTLRLLGTRSNRSAIGARIRLRLRTPDGEREIHRVVGTGCSFGSSSLQQGIGLGDAEAIEFIEVRWPTTGLVQRFEDPPLAGTLLIREDVEQLELMR